jgi:hypothetical protein
LRTFRRKRVDGRIIGERSDAVLRTAVASEATPFLERQCPAMTAPSSAVPERGPPFRPVERIEAGPVAVEFIRRPGPLRSAQNAPVCG